MKPFAPVGAYNNKFPCCWGTLAEQFAKLQVRKKTAEKKKKREEMGKDENIYRKREILVL